MEELIAILEKIGIPFAYDHFAEGESRTRPSSVFSCRGATTSPLTGECISR